MLQSTDNIRPLRDRVLVRELPWPGKVGSVYLPDQAQKRDELWRAVVIAVGPGKAPLGLLRRAIELVDDAYVTIDELAWRERRQAWHGDVQACVESSFGVDVRPGDVVLVSRYVHTKVQVGANTCSIIAASDILGVVSRGVEQVQDALLRALTREDPGLADELRSLLERRARRAERTGDAATG